MKITSFIVLLACCFFQINLGEITEISELRSIFEPLKLLADHTDIVEPLDKLCSNNVLEHVSDSDIFEAFEVACTILEKHHTKLSDDEFQHVTKALEEYITTHDQTRSGCHTKKIENLIVKDRLKVLGSALFRHNVSICGTLTVAGNVINGNQPVVSLCGTPAQPVNIGGTVNIGCAGHACADDVITICNPQVNGILLVNGDEGVTGNLFVGGLIFTNEIVAENINTVTLTVLCDALVGCTLFANNIVSNNIVTNQLEVIDFAVINQIIANNINTFTLNVGCDLIVGCTLFTNFLVTNGTAIFNDNVFIGDCGAGTGNVSIGGNLDICGCILGGPDANLCIANNTTINGNLDVTGNITESGLPVVTSTNAVACNNALARFDGTSLTSIQKAPLVGNDVDASTQATSPLLAEDCLTTNLNLALIPKGTGALITDMPDGTLTGGNARGQSAVDLQMTRTGQTEVASGDFSVIGGGQNNTASGSLSTVGGGSNNTAATFGCTVSGGDANNAFNDLATISGGSNNTASGFQATIGGGFNNTASGSNSTIPGGVFNVALGEYSFAAGQQAQANHDASFVWADNSGGPYVTTAVNQFRVRATGGTEFIGDVNIMGTLSKSAGGFDIPHPNPNKPTNTRLRHSFVEAPTAGDNIYRYIVEVQNGTAEITLPDYFEHINTNLQTWVSPIDVLGIARATCNLQTATITATIDGLYNVLIIGTREDPLALDAWSKTGVEYLAQI